MNRGGWFIGVTLVAIAGCNSNKEPFEPLPGRVVQAGETYRSAAEQYSVALPAGWKLTHEYSSLVVAADREPARRDSILVRSAPIVGGWTEKRTSELVLPATKRSILALRAARIESEHPAEYAGLAGHEWVFSFEPEGKNGTRYVRRHVTLMGKQRLFHVALTGRPGAFDRSKSEFESVLSSLKEEV